MQPQCMKLGAREMSVGWRSLVALMCSDRPTPSDIAYAHLISQSRAARKARRT